MSRERSLNSCFFVNNYDNFVNTIEFRGECLDEWVFQLLYNLVLKL